VNIHEVYRPMIQYFREGRIAAFYRLMRITGQTRVLDVGGDSIWWDFARQAGFPFPQVMVANVRPPSGNGMPWVVADGQRLPFPEKSWDVVLSNSVIEHVPSPELLASEIRRVGRAYFVQTPALECPMEPHYLTPFLHWLPAAARQRLLRNFSVWGWITRPGKDECRQSVQEIHLLGRKRVAALFPDADILAERFLGLPKSWIAYRRST